MKSKWFVHGTWAVVALALSLAVGLLVRRDSAEVERPITRLADPRDVIDQDLMVALGQAKNLYGKAKVYRGDGKLPKAIAVVREILSLRFPVGAPEADDVRHDARAMLATLLIEQGQLDEAMRVVDEGLATVTRESFFVANLWTVKAEIHSTRAEHIPDRNDPKVTEERHAAIDSFERSIRINAKLQNQLVP
jgi:hypothetical protein